MTRAGLCKTGGDNVHSASVSGRIKEWWALVNWRTHALLQVLILAMWESRPCFFHTFMHIFPKKPEMDSNSGLYTKIQIPATNLDFLKHCMGRTKHFCILDLTKRVAFKQF